MTHSHFWQRRWFEIALIVWLGVIHSVLSFVSLSTKSPTFDESIHALGGYSVRFLNDFRIDPEDPALWHRIQALAARRDEVKIDQSSDLWNQIKADSGLQFYFAHQTYYGSGSVDVESIINRRRALFSIFGAATVIGSGLLARNLAGVVGLARAPAGLFTSGLLAFDPNLLAHSSIIKNDVMMALLMLILSAALWSAGRHLRWGNSLVLIACVAIAPLIKFSGVLFAPIALAVLVIRSILAHSWPIGHRLVSARWSRLGIAVSLVLVALIVGYVGTWASYGFRFSITADHTPFEFNRIMELAKINRFKDFYHANPPSEIIDSLPADLPTDIIVWFRNHRLFPEAWLFGLLHVHVFSTHRGAYLFGEYTDNGFWYYFPSVFILKTPVVSVLLFGGTLIFLFARFNVLRKRFDRLWIFVALGLPALLVLSVSISSGLNIGIRHILPLWPVLFISIGLFLTWLYRRSRFLKFVAVFAVFLAALESIVAAPNYISFLNVVSSRMNTHLGLLSDSNLDWGQDLPGLARWKRQHPNVVLYLSYFGTADPAYYGIDYINIQPGYPFVRTKVDPDPTRPGVVAYSATTLTGVYHPQMRDELKRVRLLKPLMIIGGSIYLYKWPFDMPDDRWEAATGISSQ